MFFSFLWHGLSCATRKEHLSITDPAEHGELEFVVHTPPLLDAPLRAGLVTHWVLEMFVVSFSLFSCILP